MAQETKMYDAVYLKDSSVVYGQIMKYEPTGVLVLQLDNGTSVEYPAEQILRIKKEELKVIERVEMKDMVARNTYDLPQKRKFYGWGAIGSTYYKRYERDYSGLSIELGLGHQFHPAFMLGGGFGVTTEYIQTLGYLYGSIRGALLKKSYSPFYQVDIGYGLPLNDKDPHALLVLPKAPGPTVYKRQGGLYLHPSLGFRFASRSTVHMYLAAGCLLQWMRYEGIDWNNFDFAETVLFACPSLKIGLKF